jgi:hypothetical protein
MKIRCGGSNFASVACAIALPVFVAGCTQHSEMSTAQVQPRPVTAVAATADPVILSGVAYAPEEAVTSNARATMTPPLTNSAIVEAPAALVETIPIPPPSPVIASAPISAPVSNPVSAPTVNAVDHNGFPNINVQPAPSRDPLLTAEERAKLIAELNALAKRGVQQ